MSSTVIDGIGRPNSGSTFDTSGGALYARGRASSRAELEFEPFKCVSRASNFETREDGDNP